MIPIIDLRSKFAMEGTQYRERTCINVVKIPYGGTSRFMGTVVDPDSEVISFKMEKTKDPSEIGANLIAENLPGIAKMGASVKMLLDIDRVLNHRI